MFIGRKGAGKTVALILMAGTAEEFGKDQLGIKSVELLRRRVAEEVRIHALVDNLILRGIGPPPNQPQWGDLRYELQMGIANPFIPILTRDISIYIADPSGEITSEFSKIISTGCGDIDERLKERLRAKGISDKGVYEVVNTILHDLDGFIFVAPLKDFKRDYDSYISPEQAQAIKTPDDDFANFIANYILYHECEGVKKKLKAIVLITHIDKSPEYTEYEKDLSKYANILVEQYFMHTKNYLDNKSIFEKWIAVVSGIFGGEYREGEYTRFELAAETKGRKHIKYPIDQYVKMLKFLIKTCRD
jgi:hypothetical protein